MSERSEDHIPLWAICVFIMKIVATYSLAAVSRSTQLSALCGMVKRVSAFALSDTAMVSVDDSFLYNLQVDLQSRSVGLV